MHSFTAFHKTSHAKSFKSPQRSKWGPMHVYIARQIYYKEQQMKFQIKCNATLKHPSLLCDFDASSSRPVYTNSLHVYPFPSHHPNNESHRVKLAPNQLCDDKEENEAKSERDLKPKTCRSYKNLHYKKRRKEYPGAFNAKRQKQERPDETEKSSSAVVTSQPTPDLNFYSNWKTLLPIHSSANQMYRHQMPNSGTPFYCPPIFTQDFRDNCLIQAPEQNLYLPLPPASLWAYDNSRFGFTALSAQPAPQ